MLICLAPGHGGHDSGCVGLHGLRESDLNLDISGRVATLALMDGWRITATRSSDIFVSPDDQAHYANNRAADVLLAIHGNGSDNRKAHGVEFYTSRGQTESDKIVPHLERAWRDEFPDALIRTDWSDGDSDKEAGFAVVSRSRCPAVLVEVGFVSHPETEAELKTAEFRQRIASALAKGLKAWRESKNAH